MRKLAFCNCAADQRLCFRYTDCTIPLIHKSKFQAFRHLLWLYSSVCVGLSRKPRRPVFSQRGSNTGSIFFQWYETITINNTPLWQYADYFHSCKYDNLQIKQTHLSLIFAHWQIIEHECTWDPPQYSLSATVQTITHNLLRLRKKGKTVHPCKL